MPVPSSGGPSSGSPAGSTPERSDPGLHRRTFGDADRRDVRHRGPRDRQAHREGRLGRRGRLDAPSVRARGLRTKGDWCHMAPADRKPVLFRFADPHRGQPRGARGPRRPRRRQADHRLPRRGPPRDLNTFRWYAEPDKVFGAVAGPALMRSASSSASPSESSAACCRGTSRWPDAGMEDRPRTRHRELRG